MVRRWRMGEHGLVCDVGGGVFHARAKRNESIVWCFSERDNKVVGDYSNLPDTLALLAALRAKVMSKWLVPRVALADSGNPGLSSSTPLGSLNLVRVKLSTVQLGYLLHHFR